jgi:hypothetical protein
MFGSATLWRLEGSDGCEVHGPSSSRGLFLSMRKDRCQDRHRGEERADLAPKNPPKFAPHAITGTKVKLQHPMHNMSLVNDTAPTETPLGDGLPSCYIDPTTVSVALGASLVAGIILSYFPQVRGCH